ncbi:hypothetical protein HPP92_029032 [Vanilla planifolia]|uniref:Uncharacterized protein n=1 Tax=Vanilla planifolia TaxID=51239 RepID=A0A835P6A4_VANPL|nr:hypothetical protein HPP92_029032 [Vanilla planifolia]KAG0446049.1 hypothetical protein HPP92_029020 [Vanilla planifolia]
MEEKGRPIGEAWRFGDWQVNLGAQNNGVKRTKTFSATATSGPTVGFNAARLLAPLQPAGRRQQPLQWWRRAAATDHYVTTHVAGPRIIGRGLPCAASYPPRPAGRNDKENVNNETVKVIIPAKARVIKKQ